MAQKYYDQTHHMAKEINNYLEISITSSSHILKVYGEIYNQSSICNNRIHIFP